MRWIIRGILIVVLNLFKRLKYWQTWQQKQAWKVKKLTIETPLIDLTKAQIIQKGLALGVDYSQTISCYQADDHGKACGVCDSCALRKQGFADAGITDPTVYI